jgi:hypothetical protein
VLLVLGVKTVPKQRLVGWMKLGFGELQKRFKSFKHSSWLVDEKVDYQVLSQISNRLYRSLEQATELEWKLEQELRLEQELEKLAMLLLLG